jgi:hypothetical protein
MRVAYLDEAGIGDIDNEPIVVVAGVIMHADGQWLTVEKRLKACVLKHIQEQDRAGFYFHGKDVFSGSKHLPHSRYTREHRWALLDELCGLPHELSLPVFFAWIDRRELGKKHPTAPIKDLTTAAQAICASVCMFAIERFMRENYGNEVAFVVHENNDQSRAIVREMHNEFRNPSKQLQDFQNSHGTAYSLPFKNIVDTAHFAEKKDTPMLQLADICAFAIKRRLMAKPNSDRFAKPIEGQLIINLKGGWPKIAEGN